jgi:hypothetical protein
MNTKLDWNAIAKIGIPGVIAMFVVYRMTMGFEMFEMRLRALETQHTEAATAYVQAKDIADRALMINDRVLRVLQTMCANDARTTEARERCLMDRP